MPHNYLTPEAILINTTGGIKRYEDIGYVPKLAYHRLFNKEPSLYDSEDSYQQLYLSPLLFRSLIKYQVPNVQKYFGKADVFSLGLVMLDAATLRQHPYTHDWMRGNGFS